VTVRRSELPGVGTKYSIDLADGSGAIVDVHHRVGRWEIAFVDRDGVPKTTLRLGEAEALELGRAMAREEKTQEDDRRELLFRSITLEWTTLDPGSSLAGQTLAGSGIRNRTGVSVVAVLRGEESWPNPGPVTRLEAGDTLGVVGNRELVESVRETYGPARAGG
jgi:TrkA domain protein